MCERERENRSIPEYFCHIDFDWSPMLTLNEITPLDRETKSYTKIIFNIGWMKRMKPSDRQDR